MTIFLDSALTRHNDLARWLDYLADSERMFWILMAFGSVLTVLNDNAFALLFFGFLLLAKRGLFGPPSTFVIAIWESEVWIWLVMMLLFVIDIVAGHSDLLDLVTCAGRIVTWITLSYLVVDLTLPPRKRKKVSIRVRVRSLAPEGA